MKKKTLVIFTLAAVAAAAFTAVGCSTPDNSEGAGNEPCKHAYAYSSDGTQHWEECGLCHAKKNYADHVDALNNETEEAGADGKCDVCGYELSGTGTENPDPDEPDPDTPDPDQPDPDEPDPDTPDPDQPDPDEPDPDTPDPDEPDPEEPDDPYDDGSLGSRSNPCALQLNAFNLIGCVPGQKLYYSFTAPAEDVYTIGLFTGPTSQMCTFTTNLDEDVYYGYGCDSANKYVQLKKGETVNVILLGGEKLPEEATVSVTVKGYDGEELPEEWSEVDGLYYDVLAENSLKFNQNGTLVYNGNTCYYKYYAVDVNAVRFTCLSKLYYLRLNDGVLQLTCGGVSNDFMKYEPVALEKFTGMYSPVSSGVIAELCIYESGNGYYKLSGSSAIYCTIGSNARFDSSTSILTYGNYTFVAKDFDDDGNVISLWVKASGGGTGSSTIVSEYKRTGDAGVEVPEKLPLPSNIELKGDTMSIVCNGGYQNWGGSGYQVIVKDVSYVGDVIVYTVTNNSTPVYLSIAGENENTVVTVYTSIGGAVKDTLTVKTVEIGVLKIDGTENVLTPDDFSKNLALFTVPESGVYQFSSTYKYLYVYVNYDVNTCKGSTGFDFSINSTSAKYVLEEGSVIAINNADYGSKVPASMSFTVTKAEADPGTTVNNPFVLTPGEVTTVKNMSTADYYYAKFVAEEAGTYKIKCCFIDWGQETYKVHFTVNGVENGYKPVSYYFGYYYRDGVQVEDYSDEPYMTITLNAGEEVNIVFDRIGNAGLGDVTVQVDKA